LRPAGVTMPGPSTKGPKPTDKHVGARIRIRRLMLGMTQTTLGDAVSLTFQQIQKYGKGTNRVSASRKQQVARVLDVPMSFFFEGAPEAQVTGNRKRSTKGAVTPAYVTDFLSSREGQDIIKAFSRIKDRKLQRKIIDLAKELAAKTVH
jgi:transcriptional regulator with XRE-family HTH domain